MTDEERSYKEFQKIADREIEIESERLRTLSVTRNLIRETDFDDRRIGDLVGKKEYYVRNVRMDFRGLSKEEQNKSTIDLDCKKLLATICAVREKIRFAYTVWKEGGIDVNAVDEALVIRMWVDIDMIRRLRSDLYPEMDKGGKYNPQSELLESV